MQIPRVCILGTAVGFMLLAPLAIIGISTWTTDLVMQDTPRRLYEYQTGPSGSPSESSGKSSSGSNSKPTFFTPIFLGGWGAEFAGYIVYMFFAFCYAYMYKLNAVERIPEMHQQKPTGVNDFSENIFACATRGNMLPFVCCCPFIRQAHTNEVAGICGYWWTLAAYAFGGFFCCLGPLCLTVWFRMEIKERMGLKDNVVNDFCLAWLCWSCTIGQMALAVDDFMGIDMECPWTVNVDGRPAGEMSSQQMQAMMQRY